MRLLSLPSLIAVFMLSAELIASPAGAGAQDITYQKRFMEELQRKLPPVLIPAPSKEELVAPPAPESLPIPLAEAEALMGLDKLGPDVAARIPGGKFGIVDMGFKGLKAWLNKHPDEARLTTYFNDGKPDPNFSDAQPTDHGYWVYRVTRAVLPNVPIYLYKAGDTVPNTVQAVLTGSVHGDVVFNMSLGLTEECQVDSVKEEEFARDLRLALVQRESFLFIAEGNDRSSTDTFLTADRNRNGFVDFRTAAEAARNHGSRIDGERVWLRPGANEVRFAWDAAKFPDADYELQIVAPNGHVLISHHFDKSVHGQCLSLSYTSEKKQLAFVRIKQLAGPTSGVLMRLTAYGIADTADFNGLQTASAYTFRDNPFVIYVGAFGRTKAGKLVPSPFSDYGHDAAGEIAPDVLGPGQLVIDGHREDGTSFASPFISALYATRVGYNLKNLVERTSAFDRMDQTVPQVQRSRWGIPDPTKVTEKLEQITGPTTVTNVSEKIEGSDLVVRYTISRCCMQSLTWYTGVILSDAATKEVLRTGAQKAILAAVQLRTEKSGRVDYPVELKFPMAELAPYKGRKVRLNFAIQVRAWPHPPAGTIKIDQAPDVTLTL